MSCEMGAEGKYLRMKRVSVLLSRNCGSGRERTYVYRSGVVRGVVSMGTVEEWAVGVEVVEGAFLEVTGGGSALVRLGGLRAGAGEGRGMGLMGRWR